MYKRTVWPAVALTAGLLVGCGESRSDPGPTPSVKACTREGLLGSISLDFSQVRLLANGDAAMRDDVYDSLMGGQEGVPNEFTPTISDPESLASNRVALEAAVILAKAAIGFTGGVDTPTVFAVDPGIRPKYLRMTSGCRLASP